MKKIITFLYLTIVVTTIGFSQPVLTQSNHVFSFPDSTLYFVADTLSALNDTTGADVTFNYAYLRGYGMTQKAYYIDPASTAQASDFPTATLAEQTSVSTQNIVYSVSSPTNIINLGFVADISGFGVTTAKYNTDPEEIMRFPFEYGDTYNDTYAGSFSANVAMVGTVTTNAAGTVSVQADAWGKLILETITIDSVLRVKRVENLVTDAIVMPPLPTITPITVDATMINYYKPSLSKAPLVSFVTGSYSQNGSVIQSNRTVLSQYPMSFVSVEEIKMINSIGIYPNPAGNSSTLSIQIEKSTKIQVELLNMLGQPIRMIENNVFQPGNHQIKIDLSNLSTGVYFVSVNIGKTKVAKKLIVE